MMPAFPFYRGSLALLTDLYQLTMACGYWRAGIAQREAVFDLIFREHPFDGGFSIACGVARAVTYLNSMQFDESDCAYLRGLNGNDGQRLFDDAFLDRLRDFEFACDVDAIPEGTVVFPQEPLVRVRGPLWQCQLIETILLNIINFETLIATKAARIVIAAGDDAVLEFGLRRAQGFDGGLAASRASYVGGCTGTSNVLAGKLFDIPAKGTHAHSWVMAFASEAEAFEAYTDAMPNNSILLVDTYDTVEGVQRAIESAKKLRAHGYRFTGIRLDSGDLAKLSIEARTLLDDAGFQDAVIVGSGDLDEDEIMRLKRERAKINVWGVGTRLATAYDEPALGGVYKLSAIRAAGGEWSYKLKLSEKQTKVSNPGILQVRRFCKAGCPIADVVFDEPNPAKGDWTLIPPANPSKRFDVPPDAQGEDLLVPLFRDGNCVYDPPSAAAARERTLSQLKQLDPRYTRFDTPDIYPVGLELGIFEKKQDIIAAIQAREFGINPPRK